MNSTSTTRRRLQDWAKKHPHSKWYDRIVAASELIGRQEQELQTAFADLEDREHDLDVAMHQIAELSDAYDDLWDDYVEEVALAEKAATQSQEMRAAIEEAAELIVQELQIMDAKDAEIAAGELVCAELCEIIMAQEARIRDLVGGYDEQCDEACADCEHARRQDAELAKRVDRARKGCTTSDTGRPWRRPVSDVVTRVEGNGKGDGSTH